MYSYAYCEQKNEIYLMRVVSIVAARLQHGANKYLKKKGNKQQYILMFRQVMFIVRARGARPPCQGRRADGWS